MKLIFAFLISIQYQAIFQMSISMFQNFLTKKNFRLKETKKLKRSARGQSSSIHDNGFGVSPDKTRVFII